MSTHVLLSELEGERAAPRTPVSTIVAWGVRAPGNIGAILRLAANFACPRVVLVEPRNTKHNLRRIRKTAVDAASHVDWSFITPEELRAQHIETQTVVGLETSRDSVDLREARWPNRCTLMVGGERLGLPEEAIELCSCIVHIPTCGPLHSLNVSHALAIALFSAACQHRGS